MGNTVVWKPSGTAIYSNYFVMRLLMEAGIPAGVINFVPSRGSDIEKHVISSQHLAGVHFTGSTKVFNNIWKNVGMNLDGYRNYPRLVGEAGSKLNLLRWISARTIKENYNPPKNILYPYMEEKTPVPVKAEV